MQVTKSDNIRSYLIFIIQILTNLGLVKEVKVVSANRKEALALKILKKDDLTEEHVRIFVNLNKILQETKSVNFDPFDLM